MAPIGTADRQFAALTPEGLLLESFIIGLGRTIYCMHTHRHWLRLAIGSAGGALALALAVASASAAGLGSGASTAVLGQPLDFAVQVRLEPGDTLIAE